MDQPDLIRDTFQGRYEASKQLGEGGFGQVYQATQIATGQQVAIKVLQLKQNKQIDIQIARFQREMRLCAGLHHPHIVRLIDSGQLGDDVLCTVFEFVPGQTLGEVLAEAGALDPREATHLMTQVLDALGCAHAAGIVHRDLKPANIMVTSTGVRRNAMVLDFGIGAIVEAAQLEEFARLTKTNELLGTPAYAAPEQLRGQPPSIRSDLYSWGLVFLECLTGEQAIRADNLAEMLARQSGPEPVPVPSWLRSHQLGRVLARVLVKEVDRRLVDAAELMRELERREISGANLEALASHRNLSPRDSQRSDTGSANQTLLESFDMERHVLAGERRQVTAVCCTLEISTKGEELELRTYLGLVQALQRVWSEVLHEHDGYFAGSVGERFLFYFGYPLAKEDDAVRAARFGQALVAATQAHAQGLESEVGVRVSISIGIHTDLVVTQMMSGSAIYSDVVGLTPVVAERIHCAHQAPGGSIVVTDMTRQVLRERFVFEDAGELECPELSAPLRLHRLVSIRADTGEADHEFVGRTHELSLLDHGWGLASAGNGQTILLTAEAGVGKSRLVREFQRRLPADAHHYLVCRCAPESRNSALQPIVELLEQLTVVQAELSDETPNEGERANGLARVLDELGLDEGDELVLLAGLLGIPLEPQRYPPLLLTPERQRELTITAIVSLLLELSEQRALLFVIEDIHWADPSTLALLEQLFAEVGTSASCVIVTARPEFEVPSSLEFATQVRLTQLAAAEVAELLAALTGTTELPEPIIKQITARADGIPLFVEELTWMLLQADSGERSPQTTGVEIPTSLRDALTARVDGLGSAKHTAHVASALGREFSAELLTEVAADFVEGDVGVHMDTLVNAGLVTRKRRRGSIHYTFKHALVREVAHEAMLPDTRCSIHARIATALERNHPKVVAKRPDLLAEHHRLAGQIRQAVDYAQRAATMALIRSANLEAGAHVKAALEWLPELEDPRARAEAELDLNGIMTRVVMVTQGYGGVDMEALLSRSEQLISTLGANEHVFPNLAAFGAFHLVRGNLTTAIAHAERLVELGEQAGDTGQQVWGHAFLSQSSFFAAHYQRQREAAARVEELFDPVAHAGHMFQYGFDSKVNVDAHLCSCLSITGQLDTALEVAARARTRADSLNIPHVRYGMLFGLACMHQYRGERDAVIAIGDEMRKFAAAVGGSWYVMLVETQRAWAERNHEAVHQFVKLLEMMGTGFARGYWGVMAAELDAERGDFASGLEVIKWALANVDDGSRFLLPEMHRMQARLLYLQDPTDPSAAVAAIRNALATAREDGAKLFELRAALEHTRITTGLDENEHALDNLRAVCNGFVEGHEHPELVAAKAVFA